MKSEYKRLRLKHLQVVDKITAILGNLRLDHLEFSVYDRILTGEFELCDHKINAMELFLRACEGMAEHLAELDDAFADLRQVYSELIAYREDGRE